METIRRFINTPIDLLGMQLFDLMGALSLRVADIDGEMSSEEREVIERHFVEEWGYETSYVSRAIDVLRSTRDAATTKAIAKSLAEYQAVNPDCNGEAMQAELLAFLREVVKADGVLDEREELAIDAIATVFQRERLNRLRRVGKSLSDAGGVAAEALKHAGSQAADRLVDASGTAAGAVKRGFARIQTRKT